MNRKRVKNNRFVGVIGILVMLGSLILVILSPEVPASTRFIFIALSLLLGGLISWSLLDRHFRKSLGRAMRASSAEGNKMSAPAASETVAEKHRTAPACSFKYHVFDVNSPLESSANTGALLHRGYKLYRQYVTNLIVGALLLSIAIFFISFASELLLRRSTLPINLACGFALVLIAAFLVASPVRHPTSFTVLVWAGLNVAFFLALVYLVIWHFIPILTGAPEWRSVLLFLLAGGSLAVYGLVSYLTSSMLRRQVAAHKPLKLLVLWVFNSANNLSSTLSGIGLIWQFLGTIEFLRGGGLTVDMGELVSKKRAELVVDTPEELEHRLNTFRREPGWSGNYSKNTLLCGDRVWKSAVQALLQDSDLVAMSLFGFSRSNQGCLYELGLLFDTFPTERLLFLIDETTDLDFLLVTLQENWDNMATDSPNQTQASAPVRIYRLGTRFDRLMEVPSSAMREGRSTSGEHPLLQAAHLFSATQSAIAREADCMLKLILHGIAG